MARKTTSTSPAMSHIEQIASRILLLRNQKVMLDADLARLYAVTTKRLNEQVKRNIDRFPVDFMFKLTKSEFEPLRSQFATSKSVKDGRGGIRHMPFAFTEHGALMAASVLNTPRAVEVSVFVVRAFIRLRELLATNQTLARKLAQLERKLGKHDEAIAGLVLAIRQLMSLPAPGRKRPIGFAPWPRE
ncbi:MAG: ORF6N domain-containing protein [Sulfuricaulis sp.]